MAVPQARARLLSSVEPGDPVFLYTTRGCFRNPTRDRGRVIGRGTARSRAARLTPPARVAGRSLPIGLSISIDQLLPHGQGLVLADLVDQLDAFPDSRTWSARMRRPILTLGPHDTRLIHLEFDRLPSHDVSLADAASTYL